jgi:hypothetical protein
VASKKKPAKKSAKGKAPQPQPPPICSWPAGALPYRRFRGYDPHLTVTCATLERPQILALLAEFKNPDQKFKVLMVKGSPFVSLSISPTKGGND